MYPRLGRISNCAHWRYLSLATLVWSLSACSHRAGPTKAEVLVNGLRGLPPYVKVLTGGICAPGHCKIAIPPAEAKRHQIYNRLHALGNSGILALAKAVKDGNTNLKLNAEMALEDFGMGLWRIGPSGSVHPVDISPALPTLLVALNDSNSIVRGRAALDIGIIGPTAAVAVPKLIALLKSPNEGDRIDACFGLKGIGTAAKSALPALRDALSDRNHDVRWAARKAITSIE